MKAMLLKEDLYWVGVMDWDLRTFDVIMETEFGTTYNSYMLKCGDETVLFETVKEKFFDEYIKELEKHTAIENIKYVVVSHTEPDHAGSLAKLIDMNPDIVVVATQCAIGFLKAIINKDFRSKPVKDNSTMKIGDKTLRFISAPNLHWPDTMYTYIEELKTIVTCDSFGAHFCTDGVLRSKVENEEGYKKALKYYYDKILGPFKGYMLTAIEKISDIDIDMICTGHGPVIDSKIDELIETYKDWSTVTNPNSCKTVIIPYVSAYGYTEKIANEIAKGIRESGNIDVRIYNMEASDTAKVENELVFADGILFGSPTILGEALKPIWDLTTSMYPGIHGGKLAGAFGSYGWSGEAVPHLIERLKQLNMRVIDDGLKIRFNPSENELKSAYDYGFNFGTRLISL